MAEALFWFCVCGFLYAYVGYPILVAIVAASRRLLVPLSPCSLVSLSPPRSVTVIITAYNEERALAEKLENTFALEYPREALEILVASDGSTDRTDEIARDFAPRGVRLFRQEGRLGKTATQNGAVERATGEILLFSDATTRYRPDVLRVIVPHFDDATIGCVAGRLVYEESRRSLVGMGARLYWGYETFIKRCESRIGSLIGASGCLYAVRRDAYVPLYPEACSDFVIASKMVEQGLRTLFEPAAVCTETTNEQAAKELRMRVRIITQTFTDLWRHRALMNPAGAGFYAVQLLSHKVLRYAVPFFLLGILAASSVLATSSTAFALLLAAQVAVYGAGIAGWLLDAVSPRPACGGRPGRLAVSCLALPHYFLLANVAILIACHRFLRGERYARWEPIRDAPTAQPLGVRR